MKGDVGSSRLPLVVSGRFSQPFLKYGTVEAPQRPDSLSGDLPCRSLLPQSFRAALQESSASTSVSTSVEIDRVYCASIDGVNRAFGLPSAGMVIGVDNCNLRVARLPMSPSPQFPIHQNRYTF